MVGCVRSVDQLRYQGEVLDLQIHCEVVEGEEVHGRGPERGSSARLGEVGAVVVVVNEQQLRQFLIFARARQFVLTCACLQERPCP